MAATAAMKTAGSTLGNEKVIGVNPENESQELDLEFGSIIEPIPNRYISWKVFIKAYKAWKYGNYDLFQRNEIDCVLKRNNKNLNAQLLWCL